MPSRPPPSRPKPLPLEAPKIFSQATTAHNVVLQLRQDPIGSISLPGIEHTVLCIHVGPSALLSCRRDGKQYRGSAVHGDVDIIPAYTPSTWVAHDYNDRNLILALPQSLIHSVAQDAGHNPSRIEIRNRFQIRDPELELIANAIHREVESGHSSGRLYTEGLVVAMTSRLIAQHSSLAQQQRMPRTALSGRRLKQVLSFIEDQIADDLSLEQIASIADLSPSHLKTLFRQAMGVPVHQYVIQRRVERARILLMQDGLTMAEIAAACGFAHQSHLARHIRRATGLTPNTLRQKIAAD
ncbi:helix-turn-helix domain-containing protein [Edaphobacter albus]|uniref:helix-turn-helix domain-containing protein n=1 Tax=Edaphobacter sp. 4G125 TaxID=2763071 RepID=UPI001646BF1C|nr:AraC family transcriptional regulator [Edaphobacter sp. 4G125]QNI37958.1 helix-turn-helix transcriptional regulator [Edaphobacter sp. 4G125]